MSAKDNEDLIRTYFEVVWVRGEWDRVYEFVSKDFINHGSYPGMPSTNIEDGRRIDEAGRKAFPDIQFSIAHLAADEDWVARHWTAEATHRGEFLGIPSTGKRVHMEGMVFSRVEKGKIAEEWRIVDTAGLMQQLSSR
jgi:steroid delta-isomerase-like uncharacterized protein